MQKASPTAEDILQEIASRHFGCTVGLSNFSFTFVMIDLQFVKLKAHCHSFKQQPGKRLPRSAQVLEPLQHAQQRSKGI